MKGILKVFAVAAALAVLGITLMLMGFATGGPSAARQALNYTNLTQRHYHGWVPGWLERALGWSDERLELVGLKRQQRETFFVDIRQDDIPRE